MWLTSLVYCVRFCFQNAAFFSFAIIYCSVASNNVKYPPKTAIAFFIILVPVCSSSLCVYLSLLNIAFLCCTVSLSHCVTVHSRLAFFRLNSTWKESELFESLLCVDEAFECP